MKLKARHIIPRWPRGRSTMNCGDDWAWTFKYVRFWSKYRDWSDADLQRGVVEQAMQRDYHARQAKMVEGFREQLKDEFGIVAAWIQHADVYRIRQEP